MPEGDTIFRTARTLTLALTGKVVTRVELPRLVRSGQNLVGARIVSVESRGKNLLMNFEGGFTLHTHMKMTGSWHIYRPSESWQKPAHLLRARVDVSDRVAVCFNAPVVRLLTAHEVARDPFLNGLGPDLLAPDFDADEAKARLRANERNHGSIGEAIVDQGVMAGVGNIFKSEALFVARIRPRTPLASLDDAALARIISVAKTLLVANVGADPERRTTGGSGQSSPLWVYERDGLPCLLCGTPIVETTDGSPPRHSFFCPTCQTGALQ